MGFLKKIFSGIFGLIAGLLRTIGIGKKSEYFLELDESQTAPAQNSTPSQPESRPEPKQESAQPAATSTNGKAPQAEAKPADSAPAPSGNGAKPQQEKTPQPAMATATSEQAAPKSESGEAMEQDSTFAPQYLNPVSSQTRRRRPGANMSSFMSMAKEMKTSSNS
jgi:cytoskeletal protein RodZ